MKTLSKKLTSLVLASTVVFGSATTAFAAENTASNITQKVTQTEASLLSEENISVEDLTKFIKAFDKSLNKDGIYLQKNRASKPQDAKTAAKAMLQMLHKIGSHSFNKALKSAAKKLPENIRNIVIEKVTYDSISTVLNKVANLEGAMAIVFPDQLDFLPKPAAKIVSRAITFILL